MALLETIDGPEDLKALKEEELPALCREIRDEIIATCAAGNGAHLGASLGAVELVVAMHYVFDSPQDRIVFDVGHQAYAHKLLTGRRKEFRSIRQEGGLAGFPERAESEHDAFGVGHASTAISAGLGMIEARRVKGESGRVIALVGDGGMTGGVAFEGLNQAGYLERDLIVILNDNEMSISPNVGAMSEWFSKKFAGHTFNRWRRSVKEVLYALPHGDQAIEGIRRAIDSSKALLTPGILFEGLGFQYIGPTDGHDVLSMVRILRQVATEIDGPVLIHTRTTKGKGYGPAESDLRTRGHGLTNFEVATGRSVAKKPAVPTWTEFFAEAVSEHMAKDANVVAITAAMLEGTGLVKTRERFPQRVYDVGIAEQHAVTFAAGLACEGLRPVTAIYSTFLQRAYDQIVHDVALQNLPVVFALDRGGLVGADGKTHQGAFDIAYLRCIPNLVVMAPADEQELRNMLATSLAIDGASAFRYPRGSGLGVPLLPPEILPIGRGRILHPGGSKPDVVVLGYGPMAHAAVAAAKALHGEGIRAVVVDPRFAKPLDTELICDLASTTGRVVTVEEGCLPGGFGSGVLEALQENGLLVPVKRLGLPDDFVTHGNADKQKARFGLDATGIAAAVRSLLDGARAGVQAG
ncbi:1-deoxy-D-xylulose-5-phosphate synthase [Vulgatibacter sp.]|uniref:1-deoxy-D-xylulose-5-phosphate synthase n=1 Tax=Vulgatibacter sp. TaxID=1971226 RepID=UPI003565DEEA